MSQAKQTRLERNQQVDRFQLYKPFIFYIAVLSFMQFAVVRSGASSLASAAALFVAGLLTWGLYEYATHRWVLHREPKAEGFNLPGNLTHLRHHADPNSLQRLNVQLSESVPVCVVYVPGGVGAHGELAGGDAPLHGTHRRLFLLRVPRFSGAPRHFARAPHALLPEVSSATPSLRRDRPLRRHLAALRLPLRHLPHREEVQHGRTAGRTHAAERSLS